MGVLGNPQHEKFAQEFHRLVWIGTKPSDARLTAYKDAGFQTQDDVFAAANARKLTQRAEVKARLKELSENSEFLSCTDAAWAQRKLKALAECNLAKYLTPADSEGIRRLDLSKATDEEIGLLLEIGQDEETRMEGDDDDKTEVRIRKIRIKRADPIAAIRLMAEIAGWKAPEKVDQRIEHSLASLVAQSYQPPPVEPVKKVETV